MFERLKKSKTLRSLLGAASLVTAGMMTEAEAAPKAPQKLTQRAAMDPCEQLAQEYKPLCEQLEGNLPYCYYGKTGNVTAGCGVHVKNFEAVQELPVLKVTPKKGKKILLTDTKRLNQIANANWKDPKTQFPEVEKVEKVLVKDCQGSCPKNTDKKWGRALFLMPSNTLNKINEEAMLFHAKNAYECHPNLFTLPKSFQLVVVDLVYNLGKKKYLETYPKFQKAVRTGDLVEARKQCKTHNDRRDEAKQILIDSARLCEARCMEKSAQKTFAELKTLVGKRNNKCIKSYNEAGFWDAVEVCTMKNHSWFLIKDKKLLAQMAKNR